MSVAHNFERDLTRLDRSAFNPALGLRIALFVIFPITLAVFLHENYLLFTTLGAFLISLTEVTGPNTPGRILLLACLSEPLALGLGTWVATLGQTLSILLLGIILFFIFLARGKPRWSSLGTITAIAFSFGVGIPGASIQVAGPRTEFMLFGAFWALLGVELHRYWIKRRKSLVTTAAPVPISKAIPRGEILRSALVVAFACSVGFWIGFALSLPRDYWVVATIIITVRPSISLTFIFTSLMAVGTFLGALVAAAIVIKESYNTWLLIALLFVFVILLFSTRGVNFGLMQFFFTIYIIIFFNIAFPGEWFLAFYRLADVAIGISISLILVELLSIFRKTSTWLS